MRGYLSGGKHPYPGVSTHLHSRVYRGQTILGHNMYGTNTAVLWLLCGQRLAGPKQRVPILRDSLQSTHAAAASANVWIFWYPAEEAGVRAKERSVYICSTEDIPN